MTQVIFVCGPPCSGKSTYVREHIGRNDLIYDFDEIIRALTFNDLHDNNPIAKEYALEIRDLILLKLQNETEFDTAWIITTWMPKNFWNYSFTKPAKAVTMRASREECMRRLHENPDGRNVLEAEEVIQRYFSWQSPPQVGSNS